MRRPRAKNGSAVRKRPRRSSTATTGAAPRAPLARCVHAASRATVRTATSSASSRSLVALSSRALISGSIPAPFLTPAAAEVAALGREVLADRDVERAAVGEPAHLLEDALAERARADDLGALAVLQRAGDDLRRRRGSPLTSTTTGTSASIGLPVASNTRRGRVRPLVETIVPSPTKMLETSTASLSSPPPLSRRSSTTPSAPLLEQLVDRLAHLAVRAGA